MSNQELETFCPATKQEWRDWLHENHLTKQSIWLIQYKKSSDKPSVSWSDVVDEALCFGWIDSTRKSRDEESYIQFFTKRKPTSVWSKVNKEKIERLNEAGLIMPAGYKCVEIAKQNGNWTILDTVEELIIPDDLEIAFNANQGSKDYFLSLSKSVKKMILYRLVMAKREETRQKRIDEILENLVQQQKPKSFW